MKNASIIYEESNRVTVTYFQPKSREYLEYLSIIRVKNSGKFPVEIDLKFDGILPFAAPMPPEKHTIKAESIIDLYFKMSRWFRKYGYELK